MNAVIINRFGGPEVLEVTDLPVPEPGPGQVRIRVSAAAVNPVDVATRSGALHAAGIMRTPAPSGLGWDLAGTVDALGPGVDGFDAGNRVFGVLDRPGVALGAQSELTVVDAAALARTPAALSDAEAATLPLNALTAAQALDLLGLRAGDTLLVTGAAGAVGGHAVELAAAAGVRVLAVARDHDAATVEALGAEVLLHAGDDLGDRVRRVVPGGVDGALDAALLGLPALDAVRSRGVFVAVLAGVAPPALRGISVRTVLVHGDGPRLGALAAAGRLSARVADTLPLADVAAAHERLAAGGLRGRLVLVP